MFSFKFSKFDLKYFILETVLINVEKKADIAFLVSLAKKLGMSAKRLTRTEVGDWQLAQKIEAGMKSPSVSRSEVMKALGK